MNKLRDFALLAVLAGFCFGVSGCYTPSEGGGGSSGRFTDEASVNIVFRFYQWDNVYIIKPDYRTDGYLNFLTVDNLETAMTELHVPRDTAVVLMGWNYDARDVAANVEKWKTILASYGFRRVVCLRDRDRDKLNGLSVINDWHRPDDQPKRTAGL